MTMHQKMNVLIFLNTSPKRVVLKKKQSLTIPLSSLGFTCLYLLLSVSMWLANLLTTILTVLDVPHCLMKHVGASLRGRARKKWYVSWALIWSRHTEGGHASQDSLHYIDVEKCGL